MDLLDIIDGISRGPVKPSVHECREAVEFARNSEVKNFDYHGFTFKVTSK